MELKEDHHHLIQGRIDHIYQDPYEKKEIFSSIMVTLQTQYLFHQ